MDDQIIERAVDAAAKVHRANAYATTPSEWDDLDGGVKAVYRNDVRPLVIAALADAEVSIQAKALRDAADREDAAAPEYGYRADTAWARREAEWIERAAGLRPTPNGWCGNKEPHDPHPHASVLFGLLACVGTEEEEEA